jgi:two-component system alkaline phosphatase synthesis response regulator PhoP
MDQPSSKPILIIDDEIKLARTLSLYLEQAGFQALTAADGPAGLALFKRYKPALVLLDLNLPGGLDGLDVCRQIRRESQVPIIMLTARVEEVDRLIGLELGADDYVTKPFSPREVVARVRAVLRRSAAAGAETARLETAGVEMDLGRRRVRVGEREVELTPNEFGLLAALMRQPGQVLSRAQLLEAVQGSAFEGYERTVDQHIKNLRQKLEPEPGRPRYLLTVFGVGYKFAEA